MYFLLFETVLDLLAPLDMHQYVSPEKGALMSLA
jgi:hypothetical protein